MLCAARWNNPCQKWCTFTTTVRVMSATPTLMSAVYPASASCTACWSQSLIPAGKVTNIGSFSAQVCVWGGGEGNIEWISGWNYFDRSSFTEVLFELCLCVMCEDMELKGLNARCFCFINLILCAWAVHKQLCELVHHLLQHNRGCLMIIIIINRVMVVFNPMSLNEISANHQLPLLWKWIHCSRPGNAQNEHCQCAIAQSQTSVVGKLMVGLSDCHGQIKRFASLLQNLWHIILKDSHCFLLCYATLNIHGRCICNENLDTMNRCELSYRPVILLQNWHLDENLIYWRTCCECARWGRG